MRFLTVLCLALTTPLFADDPAPVAPSAHMQDNAIRWAEKYESATPAQREKMLARRTHCLSLTEEERRTQCSQGNRQNSPK